METSEEPDRQDSGMESGASKDETPEKKAEPEEISTVVAKSNTENYDDEPEESVGERLLGLTEMFPEPLRNITSTIIQSTAGGVRTVYSLTCAGTWLFFSSSIILFAPVIFEVERAQMEQMQRSQQKQVLLGLNTPVPSGSTR